ncbi:MAG: DUF2807 domain-containing protein [Chitinophaga sp.]|uniref:head GIN domain-containing protein n=1 Tax=Chitinophaga sp. TaxID=1869181 RepID=UPI0025B9611B|nr:head GIN domain-containing protein [Chitinophaga sp.]MBV8252475.1 DUF2807 domain-containing protein [Chitinophaga sp.]
MKKLTFLCVAMISAIVLLSSFKAWNERIIGSGNVKSEKRTAGKFNQISAGGVFKIELTQGATESIKLEAEDNILPLIETEVSSGGLEIRMKKGYSISPNKDIKVYVTLPELKRLSISGASKLNATNSFKGDRLNIDQSGASTITMDLAVSNLDLEISGAALLDLSGKTGGMNIGASGGARVHTADLRAETAKVGASGGADVIVNAAKSLSASLSGGARVKYKGTPEVQKSTSGGASVTKY